MEQERNPFHLEVADVDGHVDSSSVIKERLEKAKDRKVPDFDWSAPGVAVKRRLPMRAPKPMTEPCGFCGAFNKQNVHQRRCGAVSHDV